MKAGIITIGDEILIGQILDTNSAWISARLNETGIRVTKELTVGDERNEIVNALNYMLYECDVVILTGGLGPTKDDITKLTLADYFGCGMVRDDKTYEINERMLKARGVEFNGLNKGQAMVPECCKVLHNYNGTAPGMWFEKDSKVLVSLPGVPYEMEALMKDEVLPMLKRHFELKTIIHKTLVTFGLAESVLAETIAEWENALPPYMKLAYLPSPSQIRLRLSAYDVDGVDEEAEMEHQFGLLKNIIPAYVIGYEEDEASLVSRTAEILVTRGLTLSIAESCTGGALSSEFTALAGASEYFKGSVVSYSNDVKTDVLGVSFDALKNHGAVSREVAEEMAQGVRNLCGADYAIATTGIAGPTGGSAEKPVGTVWIAVATPDDVFSRKFVFGKLREQNIRRASAAAINFLRLVLTGDEDAIMKLGVL